MNKIWRYLLALVAVSMTFVVAAGPPAQSGDRVLRGDSLWAVVFSDYSSGLQVVLGVNVADYCSGIIEFDTVSYMDVVVGEDLDRIAERLSGNVYAEVWGFTEFDCDRFTSEMPLAWGMVDVRANDNDILGPVPDDNNNFNAFGWRSNGELSSPDTGEMLKFHFVRHVVWDTNSFESAKGFTVISLR